MIFEQLFFTIFVTTFSFILTLSLYLLSIALVFVPLPHFLCKILVVTKVVTYMDVQITNSYVKPNPQYG